MSTTLIEKLTAFGGIHPHLNDHARALVDEAIEALTTLQHRVAEMEAALEPFARAAESVDAIDPDFPNSGAALRASFDFWDRRVEGENGETTYRKSVTMADLRKARSALKDRGES